MSSTTLSPAKAPTASTATGANAWAKTWAIAQRELIAYFMSPLAYVLAGLFMVMTGYLFYLILVNTRQANLTPLFNNLSVVFLFLMPAISARLLSEERRQGTIELLMTSPVPDWAVAVGKYLASLLYMTFMFATTLIYPALLAWVGNPDWPTVASGYLGIFLLGASFLAIGLFCSSWTSNVVIAYFATFALSLLLWLLPSLAAGIGHADLLQYLSIISHQENMLRGVLDSVDVFFYLSFIVGCLFLTVRSIELYHWR